MKSKLQQWPDGEVGESEERNGEITAERLLSLLKFSASEVCYVARQNDSCFPCTTLNCTPWNTSSDKGGEQYAGEAELLQSLFNTSLLIVPGLCSQYGHASCECLYWKISCLSTWQTPSSLSGRELKINSPMASPSVRTSMRHKQAHTSSHACYTGSHICKCI